MFEDEITTALNELELDSSDYQDYYYRTFSEPLGLDISKVYKNVDEAHQDMYTALFLMEKKGVLTTILGKRNNEYLYMDIAQKHTLVAGITGEGKTTYINSLLISLLYFAHPEYLKVIAFDPKRIGFSDFDNIINVHLEYEVIVNKINSLYEEMRRRERVLQKAGNLDAIAVNKLAYQTRQKKKVMPYLFIIFDEFPGFFEWAKTNGKKEAISQLKALAGQGRSAGFRLMFMTQEASVDSIKGDTARNFQRRISFAIDSTGEKMILGNLNKVEDEPRTFRLPQFNFILKERVMREQYQSINCCKISVRNAINNLYNEGFVYKLF